MSKFEITVAALEVIASRYDGWTLAEKRGDYTPRYMRYQEVKRWRKVIETGDTVCRLLFNWGVYGWDRYEAEVIEIKGNRILIRQIETDNSSWYTSDIHRMRGDEWVKRSDLCPAVPEGYALHDAKVIPRDQIPVEKFVSSIDPELLNLARERYWKRRNEVQPVTPDGGEAWTQRP